MLSKAAIAAAVTTAVGLSLSNKASAVNGDTVVVGFDTAGTNTTSLSGGTALLVANGASNTTVTKQASIVGTQNVSNRVGVLGRATGATGGWGVYGSSNSSSGRGVYGLATGTSAVGVYGEHNNSTAPGTGVFGRAVLGHAIEGKGNSSDLLASGSGRVILSAAGLTNPPTSGAIGTIARDAAGNMSVAVAANTWRKIAGPGTAGAFHALSPKRVYDSRAVAPSPGALSSPNNRTISVKDARDLSTGAVSVADFVPAGATAIACNITVSETAGSGFLAVNPGGDTVAAASTINWSASGQILANGVIVTISATREVTVIAGGGGSANFIIDVNGYFL